jgi:hypothetical protein
VRLSLYITYFINVKHLTLHKVKSNLILLAEVIDFLNTLQKCGKKLGIPGLPDYTVCCTVHYNFPFYAEFQQIASNITMQICLCVVDLLQDDDGITLQDVTCFDSAKSHSRFVCVIHRKSMI